MKSLLSLFAAVFLIAPLAAHASAVDIFTLTSNSDGSVITFELAGSPTPTIVEYEGFEFDNVTTSAGLRNILFFDTGNGGGLNLDGTGLPYGPQLFTGTDADPTFILNTFQLSDSSDLTTNDYTLSITQVGATPEPSSLLMLGTGALAVCGAMRRRLTV